MSGLPLRPIQSTVNSHTYRLSKYLVELQKPFTVSSFSEKDSFTNANKIGKQRNFNYSMASFDIVALLANNPVNEAIELI